MNVVFVFRTYEPFSVHLKEEDRKRKHVGVFPFLLFHSRANPLFFVLFFHFYNYSGLEEVQIL